MIETKLPATDLTERDAATYLGYQPITLRAWRMQGRGPAFIRIGRSIRYTPDDLAAYRAAHRVETRDSRPVHDDARLMRAGV